MNGLYFLMSIYLTIYTFIYSKLIWKEESKFGGVMIGMLAVSFLPLSVWIVFFKS